jgi:hypothetical protein
MLDVWSAFLFNKITEDVRKFAEQQKLSEAEALKV